MARGSENQEARAPTQRFPAAGSRGPSRGAWTVYHAISSNTNGHLLSELILLTAEKEKTVLLGHLDRKMLLYFKMWGENGQI